MIGDTVVNERRVNETIVKDSLPSENDISVAILVNQLHGVKTDFS